MKSKMKIKSKLIPLALLALPTMALAQEADGSVSFVNSISLWIAIIVGLIASFMVLTYAKKIGGGVLQKVYYLFGAGMLLVVLGFLAVVVPPWASMFVIMRTHDALFIVGMGLMAFGGGKLLKAAR